MPGVLNWGYYPAENRWVPLKVDEDGSIQIACTVDELNDIGDVNVPAPGDGNVLYWDATAGKWQDKAVAVGAHKDTHDPQDGADPLDTAAPGSINENANAVGVAHSLARSDHNHQHLAALHESGGGAEISVAGLSGELADNQPPKAHKASHEDTGADEISIAGLLGEPAELTTHKGLPNVHHAVHLKTLADHPLAIIPTMDDAHIPAGIARDAEVADAIDDHAALTTGVHAFDKGARVYHDVIQVIPHNTFITLAFNSERYDTDAIHNIVTNNSRLTCKTAGKYIIVVNLTWQQNPTLTRQCLIKLNNNTYPANQTMLPPSDMATQMQISTIYNLAVNDYVEVVVRQTSGNNLNVLSAAAYSPEFMIQRIG